MPYRLMRFAVMIPLVAMTACQSWRAPAVTPINIAALPITQQWQGQFSIKLGPWGQQPADGQSFAFFMQAGDQAGQLDLMTPLGTQLAQVRWSPTATSVESADGTQRFTSLPDLSRNLLGEEVPLLSLPHWLNGKPAPGEPSTITNPETGSFEQAGWAVDTGGLGDGKLQAHRPQTSTQRLITIKVRLDR